jgi:pilus assembly protein Flp/PilA
MRLIAWVRGWLGAEDGATAIEYALMVALIAMVILAAVTILGQSTNELYQNDQLITSLT